MIDVLMSTYNGARFLEAQIDSILDQDYRDLRLLVRDDGSTDGTMDILRKYASDDPRVVIVEDDCGNLRAFASFMKLVERSDALYFMYADQDDVWLPGRVSRLAIKIRELETVHGADTPLVVFSDLTVVDENLEVIDPSLWHYQQFDPKISHSWKKSLAQNVVLGCTMIANAAARRASLPYLLPELAHDHWVVVNTARHGRVEFIREPTILYRQHGDNHSGANIFDLRFAIERTPGLLKTLGNYRKSVKVFAGVSTLELLMLKLSLNFKRFNKRKEF